MYNITKKDIIDLNLQFSNGNIIKGERLDYALDFTKNCDDWIKSLSYIVRAIVLDHVFEDGNKRTTALLIKTIVEYEGYKIDNSDLMRILVHIAQRRLSSIKTIEGKLKYVIRK